MEKLLITLGILGGAFYATEKIVETLGDGVIKGIEFAGYVKRKKEERSRRKEATTSSDLSDNID